MLLALRFVMLMIFVAGAHFTDGLAFAALAFGALFGWRAWPALWLVAPVIALTSAAVEIYAHSTGTGKALSALGNFPLELIVFTILTAIGFGLGYLARRQKKPAPLHQELDATPSPRIRGEGGGEGPGH